MLDGNAKGAIRGSLARRDALRLALGAGAIAVLPAGCVGTSAGEAQLLDPLPLFDYGHPGKVSRRAVRLVESTNTIDMLLQIRNALVVKGGPNGPQYIPQRFMAWFDDPASITKDDLRRYFLSGIRVFHPATDTAQLTSIKDPFAAAEWYFNGWQRIAAMHPEWFALVRGPDDLEMKRHAGKLKVIMGLQNGLHFRSAADVEYFYRLGQRVSQLTYNSENQLAGGAFTNVGLKPLGVEVIRAMNRVGMALDLSHANAAMALDACAASQVSPIISHTNAEALNKGFNRAMPDAVIRAVAAKGGVIGITVVRQFVTPEEPTTIEDFINHIDHVANLVGVEHVGLGSDNDLSQVEGVDDAAFKLHMARAGQEKYKWRERTEIDGLDHPRRIYDICEGLIRRGYSDANIQLVLGGNWQRVLTHIWTTRVD